MQELLTPDTGVSIRFAMMPFCLPDWKFGPPSRNEVINWEINRRNWAWAWDFLLQNKSGDYLNCHILKFDPNADWIVTRSEDIYLKIQNMKWSPIPKTSVIMLYGQPFYSSDV